MDWITLISIFFTAIATCFIAFYSKVSINLAKEIKNQEKSYQDSLENLIKQHQIELSDLYQAITIATLMGGNSNAGTVRDSIETFKKCYRGEIKIFKENAGQN